MILMIDNYDSFTYNLVQYLGELGQDLKVYRNDAITVAQIKKMKPKQIVISPGPGNPKEAGVSLEIIRELGAEIPILGVCLGHQCIGEAYQGKVVGATRLMHGKTSPIFHNGKGIFKGLDNPFIATRYHSLVIKRDTIPACLEITAETDEGEIMGVRHREYPIWGVQFHPESILTENGRTIVKNFLELSH